MGFKANVVLHMKSANKAIENIIKTIDSLMEVSKADDKRFAMLADRVRNLERQGVPSHSAADDKGGDK